MQEVTLNDMEISAIGEVANISLGNAATSLSVLLRDEVNVSVPHVEIKDRGEVVKAVGIDDVFVRVDYVKGIKGYCVLFLKEEEVKMIADIMMGSDGYGMFYQQDLSELHLSAISEAMNQMMGSAATALGIMLERMVDISTPETFQVKAEDDVSFQFPEDDKFVQINFTMQLGKNVKTQVIQMYPLVLAKALADLFLIKKQTRKM